MLLVQYWCEPLLLLPCCRCQSQLLFANPTLTHNARKRSASTAYLSASDLLPLLNHCYTAIAAAAAAAAAALWGALKSGRSQNWLAHLLLEKVWHTCCAHALGKA
jgi:hypothetical protein